MTTNKITEGNAFSLCINQAVWADIGAETTPIPANELEDVHLYIGRGPYKAQATEYKVMASGDTLIAYIDHTLKVGMYSTWITAYCNGRRVASNCKEAFEIVSFDEHCSNAVNEVYVCPAIYLQGTTAADEAIRQMQEAERVSAEAERKKTFDALKASFLSFLAESKEQWDAWMAEVRQVWTSWFDDVKTEWQAFFAESKAQEEERDVVMAAAIASLDERDKAYAQNELSRADAERGRVHAEQARAEADEERQQHEIDRIQAEQNRAANEDDRLHAEAIRDMAEKQRTVDEEARVSAEAIRENAEELRTNTFNTNEANREQIFQENENRRDEVVAAAIASINERIMAAS